MKRLIFFLIVGIAYSNLIAQQNNTLYFFNSLPQSKNMNPAYQNECKLHIGGALIPLNGQILAPIHLNVSSNGFAYKQMVQTNSKDSLALPNLDGFDEATLEDHLREVNFVTLETYINYLTVGYKYKKWYFGLDINDKVDTRFSFNKDLMGMFLHGNGSEAFINGTANLGDLGVTSTSYSEYSLSASYQLDKKWTFGIAAKVLFGKMNIWTEKSQLDLYTNGSENYPLTVTADYVVHTSQPFVKVTDLYYDYDGDTMVFESEELEPTFSSIYGNTKNFGLGFDLGATYQFNDKMKFYASLTDMGYIKWTDNVQTFSVDGEYRWNGYDFQPSITEDENIITDHNDSLKHHIIQIYEPEMQTSSYVSYITPKAYLGGTYQINEKIRTGLLLRGSFYQHSFHPSLTISGNFRVTKWFESAVSYSMNHNSYTDVGLALVAKAKWWQFFVSTDNVWGFVWPQSAHNVNYRMGINLLFGCDKKESNTLIH